MSNVIEPIRTDIHLLAQLFGNIGMVVQDGNVESREAVFVFLVDLSTILEKPLHFIHVAGLAGYMEGRQATLVFKESEHVYSQSSDRFHERKDDNHTVLLLCPFVRRLVVRNGHTTHGAAFDAPILLPLAFHSPSRMVSEIPVTGLNIILPLSDIRVSL